MFSSTQEILQRRRRLRNFSTEAEQRLWFVLRQRRLYGLKFRRQYSIGIYIVDFYCPAYKLVIEVDGSQHYTAEGLAYDRKRTGYISSRGIQVLRVMNSDVMSDMDSVVGYLTLCVDKIMLQRITL